MDSSREDSPDWLRSFEVPTHSTLTLSSDSPSSSPSRCSIRDRESGEEDPYDSDKVPISKALKMGTKLDERSPKRQKREGGEEQRKVAKERTSKEPVEYRSTSHSVWTLSSDSESFPDQSPKKETEDVQIKERVKEKDPVPVSRRGKSTSIITSKEKSPSKEPKLEDPQLKKERNLDYMIETNGNRGPDDVAGEEKPEKHAGPNVCTSRLPLLLSDKVHRTKALVECEGASIDLSGDMGSVGRVVIPDNRSGNREVYLDLKGTMYRTTIVPSRTFCVVSFGQSEAKIEAIMNDFIQLKPQSNVYEAETMVEGTLEGFSFDSEDEAEKLPKDTSYQADQNEGAEGKTKGKPNAKPDKTSGAAKKKGKTGGGKPPVKKVRKKTQASKKGKARK